jgi:adapter protein MecA 1/2
MKIEKLSDNQIRCTLTRSDLAERELKLSELAYGSEKARELFREMMQQASFEFGFEADDIPLMIEAIPVSSDCIILIITKAEDPEELDTRFSRFSPSHDDGLQDEDSDDEFELESLFSRIQEIRDSMVLGSDEFDKLENIVREDTAGTTPDAADAGTAPAAPAIRVFAFSSLDHASEACRHIDACPDVSSALYKDEQEHTYALVISGSSCDIDTVNRMCHTLSEYGTRVRAQYATENYFKEHLTTIIKKNAVSVLANL